MLSQLPPKLSLANTPTPFRLLKRLTEHLNGPKIWLKSDDMSGALLSGNKVRKLEFVLADALSKKATTIITCGGIQSNHCRATAVACAQLGLKCVLILRDDPKTNDLRIDSKAKLSRGNAFLDQLAGADIKIVPREQYNTKLKDLFSWFENECKNSGGVPYSIPTGASNGVGIWGYLSAFEELKKDFSHHKIIPDAIVCATGSGGTQAGLTLGAHLNRMPVSVVGMAVCDSQDYFYKKVRDDIEDWRTRYFSDGKISAEYFDELLESLPINTLDDYIGPGYAQTYPEVIDTIKWLAQLEGVFLDPVYTAKAFFGMISEIKKGRFKNTSNIVFVHTGGVFGTFAYASELT